MAYLGKAFNEENAPAIDLIKKGWYTAEIESTEIKESQRSDWKGLNIRYKILGPTDGGRVVFSSVTIAMPSKPDVEKIGAGQIGKLRTAVGLAELQDSAQLHGKRLSIHVDVQEGKDGYDDQNTVKNWKAVEGSAAPGITDDDIPF